MTLRNRVFIKCKRCSKTVEARPSDKRKYCSQKCHYADRPSGKDHFNWNGGKSKHNLGYVNITLSKKRILEHRLVIENLLGRRLLSEEIVHHKNGNKTDNRSENLEIVTRAIHASLHHRGVPKLARI